jgi:hypothetical protein
MKWKDSSNGGIYLQLIYFGGDIYLNYIFKNPVNSIINVQNIQLYDWQRIYIDDLQRKCISDL